MTRVSHCRRHPVGEKCATLAGCPLTASTPSLSTRLQTSSCSTSCTRRSLTILTLLEGSCWTWGRRLWWTSCSLPRSTCRTSGCWSIYLRTVRRCVLVSACCSPVVARRCGCRGPAGSFCADVLRGRPLRNRAALVLMRGRAPRPQMLSWLEAEEGCFDWGKCVRYLCEHVADDDPKAVEDRVRAAVSYVGPVDLFDSDMDAVRPLCLLEAPPAGNHKCTVCGRLVAASTVDDRVGDAAPPGEGAATSGAGSGGADNAPSADSAGVVGSSVTVSRAGEGGPAALKDSEFSEVRSGGVWRHKGPRPCRGCGLRPRVSVVSVHSVIECITKDKPQFAFVFDNALKLVTPHAGCLLIMTVNTNTKSWAGGKGRDFPAANIAVADVTDHLTARGFTNVRVTMHHGEAGTEMEETVGVTAVWPGPRRLTS